MRYTFNRTTVGLKLVSKHLNVPPGQALLIAPQWD